MEKKHKYKSPRLSSHEVEKLIGEWIRRAGKPVRWGELAIEAKKVNLSEKVLSDKLKQMVAKELIGHRSTSDESGRVRIYYTLGVDIKDTAFLPEFEKHQREFNERFLAYMKKAGRNEEKRIEELKNYFDNVMRWNIPIYLTSINTALNSKNIHPDQAFEFMLTTLAEVPAMYLYQAFLNNRDIAEKALKAIHDEVKQYLDTLKAPSTAKH